MRTILILFLVLSYSSAFAQNPVKHVTAQEFYNLIQQDDGVVLDVRTEGEYSRGHIANSTLISTSDRDFVKKAMLLQKDKPLYIYCLTGSRSYAVVNYLSQNGFTKLYNLSRGTMSWSRAGYSLVKSSSVAPSPSKAYSNAELNEIIASKQLTLLNFHAPWCAPCKQIKPTVSQLGKEYSQELNVVLLDVEANETLKNSYDIQAIPGLVLYKDGEKVWQHTGLISKEDLYRSIEKYL